MTQIRQEPDSFSDRVRQFAHRLKESKAAALAGLYDLTAQRLLRFSVTITRNQHDAEDALQAALVKVSSNPDSLCDAQHPWSYLLQIVRNEALLMLRRKKSLAPLNGIADLLTQRRVDELEQEETYRAIWTALRRIPAEQSEVIVLKIWEELTFVEIASILETSPATVASRYRYGLQKLSVFLKQGSSEVVYES